MAQDKIEDFLEKCKHPQTAKEISEMLDISMRLVLLSLKQMLKYNEIKCIELPTSLANKFYKCKKRIRMYYK